MYDGLLLVLDASVASGWECRWECVDDDGEDDGGGDEDSRVQSMDCWRRICGQWIGWLVFVMWNNGTTDSITNLINALQHRIHSIVGVRFRRPIVRILHVANAGVPIIGRFESTATSTAAAVVVTKRVPPCLPHTAVLIRLPIESTANTAQFEHFVVRFGFRFGAIGVVDVLLRRCRRRGRFRLRRFDKR